ncbi:hypothetical protein GS399_08520 [Pedobacter sp. HMF7647]|uniref:histidine kinase n=1 Tax=Hufsiella arboris TaxID=2695275 RepID=A0A7K1Y8U3_9SPHI|nr:sensor histidine kinase [Hufsiella arboris]MXV51014.1 hypothetical protein [Hufsiella arboris]
MNIRLYTKALVFGFILFTACTGRSGREALNDGDDDARKRIRQLIDIGNGVIETPDSMLALSDSLAKYAAYPEAKVESEVLKAKYFWRVTDHEEGMKMAVKALKDANFYQFDAKLPIIYSIIGNIHKEKGNYAFAFDAANKGLEAAKRLKDTVNIIYMIRLQAMFSKAKGSDVNDSTLIRQSLALHLRGLRIAESNRKYESNRIAYYDNICQYYAEGGNYKQAMYYGNKSIPLCFKYNRRLSLTYAYCWLAIASYRHNDYKAGLDYLTKSLELTRVIKNPFREMEIMRALYQYFGYIGDYKRAFGYYRQFSSMQDSLNVLNNTRQMSELQVKYETERNSQKILLLGKKNRWQSSVIIAFIVGLSVFILLLGLLFYQFRMIKRSNREITRQSEKLQVLMKELHHRVKNNLQIVTSLLSLQSNRLTDEESRQAIRIGQQRIEAMSLIHRSLYQQENPNMVNMKEYITDLIGSIMQSFGYADDRVEIRIDVEVEELDVDVALPLGLIINEWITNSFKYAFANVSNPVLSVSLKSQNGLELSVSDNGPGLPLSIWNQPQKSFGIKLVKVLSKQLGGSCDLQNQDGAVLNINIPLSKWKKTA